VILDSSAVLAIVFGEPGFEVFASIIAKTVSCSISAATLVETVIVAESRGGDRGVRHTDSLFRNVNVSIQPVTAEQAYIACQAFSTFGRGRHPAGLNFGDCFSYALAKSTGEPLLFKGDDFRKSDILSALT
jgi:ribonuclease VapC